MRHAVLLFAAASSLSLAACGPPAVTDEVQAERAYLGLDAAVERALGLGFAGFNAASSANIPEQRADGDASGEMIVTGQVDQGASANKGMRLQVALDDYADEPIEDEDGQPVEVAYDTGGTPLALTLQLRDIPDGTFSGTFVGDVAMTGDLEGDVALDLAMAGRIEEDPAAAGKVRRVPGSTEVTGTATSAYGTYDVDLTR